MVYRVPLLRVNTDILANIFAVIANLEKKESGGCNVAVDSSWERCGAEVYKG